MHEVIILTRVAFDGWENDINSARIEERIGVFSSHKSLKDYFDSKKPESHYLGWDGEVYPKYITKKDYLK